MDREQKAALMARARWKARRGRAEDHRASPGEGPRRFVGQGRSGQVVDIGQPGCRPRHEGLHGRGARRRHRRLLRPADARRSGQLEAGRDPDNPGRKLIQPLVRRLGKGELRVVSMGFLAGEDEAVMWRGLMLNRAVQHFLEEVAWGDIDYLVVDMPPGRGTSRWAWPACCPSAEVLVVTTPAQAAQKVAGRAASMARKSYLRVVGVVENMSAFTCAHGERYELFGSGGGQRLADEIGAPLLASIPLEPAVALGGDRGEPAALDESTRGREGLRRPGRGHRRALPGAADDHAARRACSRRSRLLQGKPRRSADPGLCAQRRASRHPNACLHRTNVRSSRAT